MLIFVLNLILAAVVIAEAAIIFWLVRTMKKNVNIQAAVTAQLLQDMIDANKKATRKLLRKHSEVVDESHRRAKIIQDLEASVEVLHSEIIRLEEINRLEHGIKNG